LIIETNHRIINSSQKEVYNFLMDMNNFKQLFPQDKISDWEATDEICSMKVKSMGTLGLKRVASKANTLIYLDSHGKVPFKFTLNIFISETENNKSQVYLVFDGAVNPFMKMMVEKPLIDFFNGLVKKLEENYI
jgi:carbon monoxide dehydrogenase subunit G